MMPRALVLGVVLAAGWLAPIEARALGRCDVAPAVGDGRVDAGDALVVLRAAVGLIELAEPTRAAVDMAPIERIDELFVRPLGDGSIDAVDALLCLRLAFGLVRIPPNLRLAVETVTPARPVVDAEASIRVRLENDGDAPSEPGARIVVSRLAASGTGSPVLAGEAQVATSLAPGAAVTVDVAFAGGSAAGPALLQVQVQPTGVDLAPDDDVARLPIVVNGPPVSDAGPDQILLEGTGASLAGAGTDPNDDPLLFLWEQTAGPEVALAGGGAVPSFQAPDVAVETELVFELRVQDPDGLTSATDSVRIRIEPLNDPPVVSGLRVEPASPSEGVFVRLSGVVQDPNLDPVVLAWSQEAGPAISLLAAGEGGVGFTVPSLQAPTVFRFALAARDDEGAGGSATIEFTALPINEAPVAGASAPGTVLEGRTVVLDGLASSDPDGDPLRFAWRQLAGPSVTLDDPAGPVARFVAPETGAALTLRFELRVTDPAASGDTTVVAVRVDPDPAWPAALRITVTPGAFARGSEPEGLVEIEVLPRAPGAEIADGTPVALSTDLGMLRAVAGTTRLGRLRTLFTPGPEPGVATVRASVPGTSAATQTRVAVRNGADEVGRIALHADPAVVAAGTPTPVRVVAILAPADERVGRIADGTPVSFEAGAGGFPEGSDATAVAGIAVVPFAAPLEPGLVVLTASAGGMEAAAVLEIVAAGSAAGRASLRAAAPAVVAGGPGVPVLARFEPLVAGMSLAPGPVSITVTGGLLDGQTLVEREPTSAAPDLNLAPFGDFPGPGDLDRDGDGAFDGGGAREVATVLTAATPGVALVRFGAAALAIPVLASDAEPARAELATGVLALVPGLAPAGVTARISDPSGDPVPDGVPVSARASDGAVIPAGVGTIGGLASFAWQPPGSVDLAAPAWLRIRAGAAVTDLPLAVAPAIDTPVAIDLSIEPRLLPVATAGAARLVATVREADGDAAADGTRVFFEASAGVPSAAWASTLAGRAEVALEGPLHGGPFDVSARIAGSAFASRAVATAARPGQVSLLLAIGDVGPIGSLTVSIDLPEGMSPVAVADGVAIEILGPPQGGVGNGFAFASFPGGSVQIALISAVGFHGPGRVLRLPLTLEPGLVATCDAFSGRIVASGTDPMAVPVPALTLACDSIVVDPSP